MSDHQVSDPLVRRLLAFSRLAILAISAIAGLVAFGTVTVTANDGRGLPPRVRGFFPSERPFAELRQNGYPVGGPQSLPVIQLSPGPRSGPLVAATGAYSGFLPIEPLTDRAPRRSARSGVNEGGAALTTSPAFYPSNGPGQGPATNSSVFHDATLRVGDIVMTRTGMKVFDGGQLPYREANFTPIGQSELIDPATRDALLKVEQASLPGKSGLFNEGPSARNGALRDRSVASRAAETTANIVRYVGPDRTNAR